MSQSGRPSENKPALENLEALTIKAQKELDGLVRMCKQEQAEIRGRKKAIKALGGWGKVLAR
jgi:hypothetical protein